MKHIQLSGKLFFYSTDTILLIAVCKDSCVVLMETENENDSADENYVAKMMLQNDVAALAMQADGNISPNKPLFYFDMLDT